MSLDPSMRPAAAGLTQDEHDFALLEIRKVCSP